MTILAITAYTGSEKLVVMTEGMISFFAYEARTANVPVDIVAVNNAASRTQGVDGIINVALPKNEGFGNGVNEAIGRHWDKNKHSDVLVLNNDLQFPDPDWLPALLKERETFYTLSPCTDITASPWATAQKAKDAPAVMVAEVSAFCWLVPSRAIAAISSRWGFPLFHPQFSNYGSDDATAAILRKLYGARPFKVVPRSWVKHLKAQTANELGVRGGTKELLTDLKKWKSANKLK